MRRGKIYDWLPLWRNKWLMGSTRWELDPGERGVFIDFLCLAGADDGFIRSNPMMGYPPEYLGAVLRAPTTLIISTIEKCSKIGKITKLENNILYINSWKDYQLDPRRKRELMQSPSSIDSNNSIIKENLDLDDTDTNTERSGEYGPEMRLVLGGDKELALDKAIEEERRKIAKIEAQRLNATDNNSVGGKEK